ncbi:transcriptional regulator [Streptosporangium sp. NPDC049078]|uniref:transcriptional regulator n=1 Tax=Streptosporangium sp. NPDC049078 TaxID=3155767 RepID=UPI0034218789
MTVETLAALATFAAVSFTLLAAHSFGDHWVQTHRQACAKGAPTRAGRAACARHVATLTITKAVALGLVMLVTGLRLDAPWLAAGLLGDAASHYWADRRTTLAKLAERIGKGGFYRMGEGLASGAYALDQSWHHLWLFLTALIIAGGGT